MKVLVFDDSPRKNGTTATLPKKVPESAHAFIIRKA